MSLEVSGTVCYYLVRHDSELLYVQTQDQERSVFFVFGTCFADKPASFSQHAGKFLL